jgi:hypothetical protein
MKKSQLLLPVFILLLVFKGYSQVPIGKKSIAIYKDIAMENIFVQQNSSFLFSGEQLLYKVYCLNKDNTLGVSKIAYVELIDKNKKAVFKHKVRVNSATANGDFTIPFSVPTGNYKLIAYTQWMRNSSATNFFQSDVNIINPFAAKKDDITIGKTSASKKVLPISVNPEQIRINLGKTNFNKREKVEVNIRALQNRLSYGNYTLSVRKKDDKSFSNVKINNYKQQYQQNNNIFNSTKSLSVYPPEHNGELITGVISKKKNNKPAFKVKVALSIPGENFIFKTTRTNESGVFYFDLDKEYIGKKVIIQVSDEKKENFTIALTKEVQFDYSKLKFNKIQVTENDMNFIKKKSEYVQIENAYRQAKQDLVVAPNSKVSFYKPDYTFVLNDYKRFPTVKETMVEVITHTWVTTKRGKHTFFVRDYKSTRIEDILPMILIDGVLIQNHEDLYDYDVKKIKAINIITDKFSFENELYGGVIFVETNNKDFTPITKGDFLLEKELIQPIKQKKYFEQKYTANNALKRIPDFREQLLWKPNFNLKENTTNVSFYTSDLVGDFELKIEGFTYTGKPVSITKSLTVK